MLDLGPKGFLLGFQTAIKLDTEKSPGKMNHEVQISWLTTLTFYIWVYIYRYVLVYICVQPTSCLLFFSATKLHSEPLAAKYIVKGRLLGISF